MGEERLKKGWLGGGVEREMEGGEKWRRNKSAGFLSGGGVGERDGGRGRSGEGINQQGFFRGGGHLPSLGFGLTPLGYAENSILHVNPF